MWLPTASSVGRGLPAASPVAQGTGGAEMSSTLLLLLGTSLSAASLSPRRAQESPFIISLHRALPPTLPGTKKVDLVYGFDLMKRLVLLGFVSATTAHSVFDGLPLSPLPTTLMLSLLVPILRTLLSLSFSVRKVRSIFLACALEKPSGE